MSDKILKFIDVIPSKGTITPGTSLNVLGGVINPGEAVTVKITLWGKAEDIWKPLLSQEVLLEEKELLISDKIPEKDTPGKLIFVEGR